MKSVMLQIPTEIYEWIKGAKGERSIPAFILDVLAEAKK